MSKKTLFFLPFLLFALLLLPLSAGADYKTKDGSTVKWAGGNKITVTDKSGKSTTVEGVRNSAGRLEPPASSGSSVKAPNIPQKSVSNNNDKKYKNYEGTVPIVDKSGKQTGWGELYTDESGGGKTYVNSNSMSGVSKSSGDTWVGNVGNASWDGGNGSLGVVTVGSSSSGNSGNSSNGKSGSSSNNCCSTSYTDKTAPTIAFNPTTKIDKSSISVGVTLSDSNSIDQRKYEWTNTTQTPSAYGNNASSDSFTATLSSEGTWYLHAYARDTYGNEQKSYAGPYIYDKTAPILVSSVATESPIQSSSSITVTASDNHEIASMKYQWSTSASAPSSYEQTTTSTSFSTSQSQGGTWYLHVEAQDKAGNVTRNTFTYFVGIPAGTISFINPNANTKVVQGGNFLVQWNAISSWGTGQNPQYELGFFDGTQWKDVQTGNTNTSYTYNIPVSINTAKAKFRVRAKNSVGAGPWAESVMFAVVNNQISMGIIQDPVLTRVIGYQNKITTNTNEFKITLEYSNANEYQISLNGQTWTNWTSLATHDQLGYIPVSGITNSGMNILYVQIRNRPDGEPASGRIIFFKE